MTATPAIDGFFEEAQHHQKRLFKEVITAVGDAIGAALDELAGLDKKALVAARHEKFLSMGHKSLS